MNKANMRSSLLLCLAAMVLAAAGSANAATYVPLNLSGGFNMNAMIGPVVASQATLAGSNAVTWLGQESQGFSYVFPGTNQNELVCDSSSNDGLAGTTYKYFCTGYGGFSGTGTLTGSQGLPENGIVNSAVDSRTYLIASVSGNALLPGDWTEPPYLGVNPNTYTASNNKFNAIWVGQTGNGYGNAYKPFVTASFQPGYYSDLNILLAGEYEVTKGCAYTQIWATYANVVNGSNSLKLYDWGAYTDSRNSYPIITQSVAPANFKLAYTVGSAGRNGSGSKSVQIAWGTGFKEYLWEFNTPLTIDPARVLVSLTVSSTRNGGNNNNAVIVYGATSTASATASNTLTLNQTTGGTISASQSGVSGVLSGYPYGAQITLTASANTAGGYTFSSWSLTPATGHGTITGTGSQAVLTIYGNCTVSANFASSTSYSVTVQLVPAGWITYSPSTGLHHAGDVLNLVATPSNQCQFSSWNVTGANLGPNVPSTTATITNNVVLSAVFAASFTDVITVNDSGGSFSVSPSQAVYNYGANLFLTATAAQGYTFVNWIVTGGAITNSLDQQAVFTVYGDFTITASFTPIDLTAALNSAWNLAAAKLNADVTNLHNAYPSTSLVQYPSSASYGATWTVVTASTEPGWYAGFLPGCFWLTYLETGSAAFLADAINWTAGSSAANVLLYNSKSSSCWAPMDHDLGFRNIPSFYNAYLISNDDAYRATCSATLLNAAYCLNFRFNQAGISASGIRCTDDWVYPYPIIVDTMMNDPLLLTAWDLAGRPTTLTSSACPYAWYLNAVAHANTERTQNLRLANVTSDSALNLLLTTTRSNDDGSSYHCVLHNDGTHGSTSANGSIYKKETINGYGNETTWSRGQAWLIYGYAEVYRYTMNDASVTPSNFLDTARRAANYFVSHLPNNYIADPYNYRPGDFVPPEDFDAALGEPAGPWSTSKSGTRAFVNRDTSAAAVAAAGLFDLYLVDPDSAKRTIWFQNGQSILNCLLTYSSSSPTLDYLNTITSSNVSLLLKYGGAWNSGYNCCMTADYYLLDAMNRYQSILAELELTPALSPSQNWVNQNTPDTLAANGGQALTLTLDVAGNASPWLSASVTQTGPGHLVISPVPGNPLAFTLQGSLRSDDVAGVGPCTLNIVVANDRGVSSSTNLVVNVRRLGDTTGETTASTPPAASP